MRDTVDVDVTHRLKPFARHDLIWGLGYRWTRDETADSFPIRLDPEEEADDIASLFFQDEIELAEEVLKLTLGCRFEHNDYTGFEVQPSARVALRPHERHMVWAAVSRAVRTPSRTENDVRYVVQNAPGAPFDTQVHIVGQHDFKSEELIAFELGYRLQPADALTLDTAVFLNLYDDVMSLEPAGTVPGPPTDVVLQSFENLYEARTYGAEVALTWQPAKGARFYGAYTYFRNNMIPGDSLNTSREGIERNDPKGQAYVRASLDLVESVQIDLMGRYVGPLGNRNVDAYAEADIRLAWRPSPSLELSVVGQNLLHDEHFENTDSGLTETATEAERGVYFMADWRF
jgi:iron complex outermembrane receptor protein